jgi:hypothetical protein
METKSKIQEKREYLKALSNSLKILKMEGAIKTVNGGLKALYAQEGHTELKTTDQEGESALLLRAKSKKINTHNPAGPARPKKRTKRIVCRYVLYFQTCSYRRPDNGKTSENMQFAAGRKICAGY